MIHSAFLFLRPPDSLPAPSRFSSACWGHRHMRRSCRSACVECKGTLTKWVERAWTKPDRTGLTPSVLRVQNTGKSQKKLLSQNLACPIRVYLSHSHLSASYIMCSQPIFDCRTVLCAPSFVAVHFVCDSFLANHSAEPISKRRAVVCQLHQQQCQRDGRNKNDNVTKIKQNKNQLNFFGPMRAKWNVCPKPFAWQIFSYAPEGWTADFLPSGSVVWRVAFCRRRRLQLSHIDEHTRTCTKRYQRWNCSTHHGCLVGVLLQKERIMGMPTKHFAWTSSKHIKWTSCVAAEI